MSISFVRNANLSSKTVRGNRKKIITIESQPKKVWSEFGQ